MPSDVQEITTGWKKMHFTISLQCGYENKPIVWRHEKVKKTSMFSLSKKD